LAVDQIALFARVTRNGTAYAQPAQQKRTRPMATAVLGAPGRRRPDFEHHLDYIHFNPVKHGYVHAAGDWPYSSFRQWVARGGYEPGWGRGDPE
jgi:REP element-mobilizing transposase RayT